MEIKYVVAAESPKGLIYVSSYQREHDGTSITPNAADKYPTPVEASMVADKLNKYGERWAILPVTETYNGWSQLYGI